MRLVIIGYSGAGKTTLAKSLGEEFQAGVFHVDDAIWIDHVRQREVSESVLFAEACMTAMQDKGWIIDGYHAECVKEKWLSESDLIVFLRLGMWTCFWSVAKRYVKHYIWWTGSRVTRALASAWRGERNQLTADEAESASFRSHVCRVYYHLRYVIKGERSPELEAVYMGIGERYPEKFVVLRSRREIRQFRKTMLKKAKS